MRVSHHSLKTLFSEPSLSDLRQPGMSDDTSDALATNFPNIPLTGGRIFGRFAETDPTISSVLI